MLASHHLYTAQLFDASAPAASKLNMTAVSSRRSLLFVALGRRVSVYTISHHAQPPVFQRRLTYAQPIPGDEINSITLGRLASDETVVAVYDSGRTVCWKVDTGFPVLWDRPGRVSTWGCAVHEETDAVAISANSHTITVIRSPHTAPGSSGASSASSASDPAFRADEEFELAGHASNIPCVSFSASGRYLASASIDFSVRIWSTSTKQLLFIFRYSQWCWAVAFVYPFYFMPAVGPPEAGKEDVEAEEHQEEQDDMIDELRSESRTSSQLESEYFEVSADYFDEPQSSDAGSLANEDVESMPRRAIDHSDDIANGLPDTQSQLTTDADSGSDFENASDPAAAAAAAAVDPIFVEPTELLEPENGSAILAHPLLLCSTRKDVLLLNPLGSTASEVVVDRVEYAVCRTSRPSLIDLMVFDRITVLEWIPDMAIVIAGSYSGTIAVIKLETLGVSAHSGPQYRMRRLFLLPQKPVNRQLYGVAVYRNPVDTSRFHTITLYIAYLDGQLVTYELFYAEGGDGVHSG
ncbi:hypothetical protein FB645_006320 [Coemansia sp. IMI 203386]|nr:hypothetical protein FB645_006320 [Coemansia sp. IMI 203386]